MQQTNNKITGFLSAATLVGVLFSTTASAATVAGISNFGGSVTVTETTISFFSSGTSGPGVILVGTASGSYTGQSSGSILNLNSGMAGVGSITPIPKFLTFNGTTPISPVYFDLNYIFKGYGTGPCDNTIGALCTPSPFSPFTLEQTSNGVTITLSLAGVAYTGTTATGVSPTTILLTTQAAGTVTSILTAAANGGFNTTYSATLTSTAPPPSFTCSVTQGGWGAPPHGNNPGAILAAAFPKTYPSGVTIGEPLGFNYLTFTSAANVRAFLPQGGPPSFLNSSATNPTGSSAGVFAGQVLALQLNVDIQHMGSVIVSGTGTPFDGQTVAVVLAAANLALGGGPLPPGFASYSALNDLVDSLNQKYDTCP